MRLLVWHLVQSGWCPYKKGKWVLKGAQRCEDTEERPCRGTAEGTCLQDKEGDLRRNQPCWPFDLGLTASKTGNKAISPV